MFSHPTHVSNLRTHRERYFEADGFQKFYRDNTPTDIIDNFRRDIHLGVRETLRQPAADQLARVDAAMQQAAIIAPAGPLARHAHVPVKQGMCHHLVSDRSEEHTSELQSLMRISYAVFCLKKKNKTYQYNTTTNQYTKLTHQINKKHNI